MLRRGSAQHLHAVGTGHAQIGDDDVRLREVLDRLEAIRRLDHLVTLATKQCGEHASEVLLVVGDEDLGGLHRLATLPCRRGRGIGRDRHRL